MVVGALVGIGMAGVASGAGVSLPFLPPTHHISVHILLTLHTSNK